MSNPTRRNFFGSVLRFFSYCLGVLTFPFAKMLGDGGGEKSLGSRGDCVQWGPVAKPDDTPPEAIYWKRGGEDAQQPPAACDRRGVLPYGRYLYRHTPGGLEPVVWSDLHPGDEFVAFDWNGEGRVVMVFQANFLRTVYDGTGVTYAEPEVLYTAGMARLIPEPA